MILNHSPEEKAAVLTHPIARILGFHIMPMPAPAVTNIMPLPAPPVTPKLPYRPEGISQALREHPHWLVADCSGRPVARLGVGNSKTNPKHWTDFTTASRIAESELGLWPYIVLTDDSLFTIFDVDRKPRRDNETPAQYEARIQRAEAVLEHLREKFPVRYESRSKSGKGIHIVISGKFVGSGGKGKNEWSEVEIYTRAHGIALTGHVSEGHDNPAPYPAETLQALRDRIKGESPTPDSGEAVIEVSDEDATEDTPAIVNRLNHKNRLVPKLMLGQWEEHGFPSQSEADFSLACSICEETGNHTQQEEIFRESGLHRGDRKMRMALKAARKNVTKQRAEKLAAFENIDNEEDDSPAPPFPLHCLPPVAKKMAREMARVTTAQNEPLASAAILGTLSASIGAGLELPTGGGRTVRGNLFLLAVAESGTGKGENFTLAAAPFLEAEGEAVKAWEIMEKPGIESELALAEKRAKRFCDVAAKATDAAHVEAASNEFKTATARAAELARKLESGPRYRVADVTKEALAAAMQGQPGEAVASMSSEARGIFSIVKGRYGKEGGDEDFYCSGYSGDSLTVDRIGRQRVTLRRPCLSILWMVQPDAARTALEDPSLMESGMIPRFLMFDPKAEPKERFKHPDPIAPAVQSAWHELIRELVSTYRNNGNEAATVNPSDEAIAALEEFERENVRRRQRAGDLADVAKFVSRWTENASRLALILHSARHGNQAHSRPLEPDTARNAIDILRWFAARQLEMLHSGRREKRKKDLLALLAVLAEANGKITFRELRRSHSLEDKKIRDIHSFFPNAFNIVRCETGGRPSLAVTLPDSKMKKEG